MKRKLPEKFFEQNQRAKTRKWKFFNLNQTLWGAGNREFRFINLPSKRHRTHEKKLCWITVIQDKFNENSLV